MKKQFFPIIAFSVFIITSCNNTTEEKQTSATQDTAVTDNNATSSNADITGSWVEPNPIDSTQVQGFELLQDSTAKSINMATLVYDKWWVADNKLYLKSTSIGSHLTLIDTSAYDIISITKDSLLLKDHGVIIGYKRN